MKESKMNKFSKRMKRLESNIININLRKYMKLKEKKKLIEL